MVYTNKPGDFIKEYMLVLESSMQPVCFTVQSHNNPFNYIGLIGNSAHTRVML